MAEPEFIKPGHLSGKICTYCDEPMIELQPGQPRANDIKTKDHLVPKVLGIGYLQNINARDICGGHGNGVWCCMRCNTLKGSMLPDQIRIMAAYHDQRAELLRKIADRAEEIIKHRRLIP